MALTPRATHVLQWPVQRVAKPRGGANLIKTGLSSDWRLQLASMKSESLVNVGQHTTLNTFPGRPNIRKIRFEICQNGPGNAGIRHFLRSRLPSVKYHNPNITTEQILQKHKEAEPCLKVVLGSEWS